MHRDPHQSEIGMRQGVTRIERDRPLEHLAGALVVVLVVGPEVSEATEQTIICRKAGGRYPCGSLDTGLLDAAKESRDDHLCGLVLNCENVAEASVIAFGTHLMHR